MGLACFVFLAVLWLVLFVVAFMLEFAVSRPEQ